MNFDVLPNPEMMAAAAVSGGIADVRNLPFMRTSDQDPCRVRQGGEVYGGFNKRCRAFDTESYKSPGAMVDLIAPYMSDESQEDKYEAQDKEDAVPVLPKSNTPKGVVAPLDIHNIDTDMIIPKEFLKTIQRSRLGSAAFVDLRYENSEEGATIDPEVVIPRDDFVLNKDGYDEGKM